MCLVEETHIPNLSNLVQIHLFFISQVWSLFPCVNRVTNLLWSPFFLYQGETNLTWSPFWLYKGATIHPPRLTRCDHTFWSPFLPSQGATMLFCLPFYEATIILRTLFEDLSFKKPIQIYLLWALQPSRSAFDLPQISCCEFYNFM